MNVNLDKYINEKIKNIFKLEEKSKYKHYGQILAKLMNNIDFKSSKNEFYVSIDPIDNNILNVSFFLSKFTNYNLKSRENKKEDYESLFKDLDNFIWSSHSIKFNKSEDLLKPYVYRLSIKIFKESFYENFGRTINDMYIKDFSCEYRIKQDKHDYNKLLISFKLDFTNEDKEKYNIEKI